MNERDAKVTWVVLARNGFVLSRRVSDATQGN